MSQLDDDNFDPFDALLEKATQTSLPPAADGHGDEDESSSSSPDEAEPDNADELTDQVEALVEAAPPSQTRRLAEVEGDDALDFIENSGFKRDRSVPDRCEPWMVHHKFTLATSVAQVNQIVDECIRKGSCSLDLECEGLDNRIQYRADGSPETVDKIVGFCISYDGHEGFYIPVRHRPIDGGPDLNVHPISEVEAAISRLCHAAIPEGTPEDIAADELSYKCLPPQVVIYFWNAQFDHEFLYPITGIDWWHPASFEDGMLACFCIYSGDKQIGLKPKAKELLRDCDGNPYTMIKLKELFHGRAKDIQFEILAPDEPGVLRYAGSDAICTYLLCKLDEIVPTCLKRHALTYRIEKQTSCAVRVMERARVRINREHVRGLLVEHEAKKAAVLEKIRAFSLSVRGIELDPNSPKQLSEFLFGPKPDGLDIFPKPATNEASGQFKTDGGVLEELAKAPHAPGILKDIVRFREAEKFIGTYLSGLTHNPDENDEIRVSFKQTGAASGRFSAPAGKPDHGYSGVPVHGIPQESDIRRDFIARPGYTLVKADYAAEELRIAANVAGEKIWIDEFMNGVGDLHSITARSIYRKETVSKEERGVGKIVNFLLLYGGGPQAIMKNTACDEMEAKRRKQGFENSVPTFMDWSKRQHKKVKEQMGVTTAFGRWLYLPDANHSEKKIQAAVERHAVNYQIQGAGADIMKICLIMLTKKFHKMGWLRNGGDDSVRMLLTVHDEVVFEIRHDRVAEAVPVIVDIMERPWKMPTHPKWTVPLVVEPLLGFNWKSGYAAERAKENRHIKKSEIDRVEEGISLRKHEVLMNGFVYSTTREPKKDKKTKEIVEVLDQQEVVDGEVFRIIDPPWLVGVSSPSAPPTTEPDDPGTSSSPAPQAQPVDAQPMSQDPAPCFAGSSTVQPKAQVSTVLRPPSPVPKVGELRLRLSKLSLQTAEQMCHIIINTRDTDVGVDLHLTDVSGLVTLIAPGRFKVHKNRFIKLLNRINLLCEADLDAAQATN